MSRAITLADIFRAPKVALAGLFCCLLFWLIPQPVFAQLYVAGDIGTGDEFDDNGNIPMWAWAVASTDGWNWVDVDTTLRDPSGMGLENAFDGAMQEAFAETGAYTFTQSSPLGQYVSWVNAWANEEFHGCAQQIADASIHSYYYYLVGVDPGNNGEYRRCNSGDCNTVSTHASKLPNGQHWNYLFSTMLKVKVGGFFYFYVCHRQSSQVVGGCYPDP